MASETWKPLDWLETSHLYLASSEGRIKRAAGETKLFNTLTQRENVRKLPERVLSPPVSVGGYRLITLQLGGGRNCTYKLSRLICRAFHGPPPADRPHCAHMDGNKLNDRAENLAWVSAIENEAHKLDHGTRQLGSGHHAAKLNEEQVREIRKRLDSGERGTDLAAEFGVTKHMISKINCGHNWTHVSA